MTASRTKLEGKRSFERRRETNRLSGKQRWEEQRGRCETGRGRGGKKQQWRVNVSVFVLSRRRARLNTSPVEWMSVSMSRLEAGRPSCDSMWLPAVGFSHLLLYLQKRRLLERRSRTSSPNSRGNKMAMFKSHIDRNHCNGGDEATRPSQRFNAEEAESWEQALMIWARVKVRCFKSQLNIRGNPTSRDTTEVSGLKRLIECWRDPEVVANGKIQTS